MSLAALDALENLLTDFIEPLHLSQRQNIVDSFARLDFLTDATLPPQTLEKVLKSLNLSHNKMDIIKLSTNRPNIMHTVIPMLDSIKNFSNLDFLVSVLLHPPMTYPPKSLIFIDHKLSTAAVARYLNTRLPEAVRRVFKFRYLHSSMSMEHNEMVFDEFRKPDGLVQGIVATSGASMMLILFHSTRCPHSGHKDLTEPGSCLFQRRSQSMLDVEGEQVLRGDVLRRHMKNQLSVLHLHINLTGDKFYGARSQYILKSFGRSPSSN
ncbi:hypothetical protein BDR06DRAFT_955854 [Suillus hirtellus]|nr:hypothetical protein BDR06DRAFT_955854 [Suillus hirtellus]